MDRYVKGLLAAYDRVLNLMEAIDPEHKDISLECLRTRIDASIAAYLLFLRKEDIDEYESEIKNKIKALEGNITLDDINAVITNINSYESACKVLDVPEHYFHNKSKC